MPRRFDPVAIPAVCFTEPEIVSVGLSPSDAGAGDIEVITSQFPFAANGRALSMEAGEQGLGGFVQAIRHAMDSDTKIIVRGVILCHIATP